MFLKISQCSQGCTCARVSFSIKLQAWDQQLYWKRRSSTGNSFLVSFAKFLIKPFLYRTPLVAAFEVISFIVITGIFLYQIYYLQLPCFVFCFQVLLCTSPFTSHCMKNVRIRSFSGPHFPDFYHYHQLELRMIIAMEFKKTTNTLKNASWADTLDVGFWSLFNSLILELG